MALVIDQVSVIRGDAVLLDAVSFDVQPGEIVGILGPNGAGKSTMLRAISGEDKPSQGAVHYDGVDIGPMHAKDLAALRSLVPQSQATPFNFSVRDILELGVDPTRAKDAQRLIADVADELEVSPLLGRPVSVLSGGEMQRVRIGRALLQLESTRARYLLLDEPTSAQDPGRSTLLADLLRRRAMQRQVGVVVIVHDLNLAARLCDRLVLLYKGRLLAQGTPRDVLTKETLTQAFGQGLHVIASNEAPPIVLPQLEALS